MVESDDFNPKKLSHIIFFNFLIFAKPWEISSRLANRTADGEMFVVKDPDEFAAQIIPQYFDHNKFSSFARQLNFYGFRKMQSKPIRNSDFDANTAKHVTFYNENFKRGRHDLLKKIQRSTRGGGSNAGFLFFLPARFNSRKADINSSSRNTV